MCSTGWCIIKSSYTEKDIDTIFLKLKSFHNTCMFQVSSAYSLKFFYYSILFVYFKEAE